MVLSSEENEQRRGRLWQVNGAYIAGLVMVLLLVVLQPLLLKQLPVPPDPRSSSEMSDVELKQMVRRAFQTCLHRLPRPESASSHVANLRSNPQTEEWFRTQLTNSPERLARESEIGRERRASRYAYRWLALCTALLLLFDWRCFVRSGKHICSPYGLVAVFVALVGVFLLNASVLLRGLHADSPFYAFPISMTRFDPFFATPWLAVFIALLMGAVLFAKRLNVVAALALAAGLTVSVSLVGEPWPNAFVTPMTAYGGYFLSPLDTIFGFLKEFNTVQPGLGCHPSTHPPLGGILTELFYRVANGNLIWMSVGFATLSLLSLPLLRAVFSTVPQASPLSRNLAVLAFAAMPAYAIYAIYRLDAIILLFAILHLLGMRLLQADRWVVGFICVTVGLLLVSLLSFASLFLVGVMGVVFLVELGKRQWRRSMALFLSGALCLLILALLIPTTGYNHLQAFLTASASENPDGFRILADPMTYLVSRLENILEIVLFASLPVAGALLAPAACGIRHRDCLRDDSYIAYVAVAVLGGMFLTGAYHTGETARACLFLYPYLWLIVVRLRPAVIRTCLLVAGLQTALMESYMYFWA